MSDELPPPPLRLKPRVRPEGESIEAAPTTQETGSSRAGEVVPAENEAPRLRLRPKLDTGAVTENPPTPVETASVEVPAAATFSLRPRISEPSPTQPIARTPDVTAAALQPTPVLFKPADPDPAPAIEVPKFKLKEKPPSPVAVAAATAPAAPSLPPPIPVQTGPAVVPAAAKTAGTPTTAKLTVALPPPVPKLKVKLPEEDGSSGAGRRRAFPAGLLYALAVVLLAGAYFGYRKFHPLAPSVPTPTAAAPVKVATTPAPKSSPSPAKPVEPPKRPSTPSATLNELSTIPARAIAKAQATLDVLKPWSMATRGLCGRPESQLQNRPSPSSPQPQRRKSRPASRRQPPLPMSRVMRVRRFETGSPRPGSVAYSKVRHPGS